MVIEGFFLPLSIMTAIMGLGNSGGIKMPGDEKDASHRLFRIRTGDLVSWSLTVGFGLVAIYFFLQTREKRNPTFYVDPNRTIIVSKKVTEKKDMEVYYKKRLIKDNGVTAVRIFFWNSGNLAIKKDHILQDILLEMDTEVEIADLKVLRITRDITRFDAEIVEGSINKIRVFFDILENDDGGVIQIIFIGDSRSKIDFQGTIEGVRGFTKFTPKRPSKGVYDPTRKRYVLFFGSLVGFGFFIFCIWSFLKDKSRGFKETYQLIILASLAFIAFVVFIYWFLILIPDIPSNLLW